MRRFFRWLGEVAGGFSTAFLAFVTLLGAIGVAIAVPFSPEQTCWPQHTNVYIFETFCANVAADWAWWGTIELARYAVAMPALALYRLQEALLGPEYYYSVIDIFVWSLAVLVCLVVWVGFRHLRAGFAVLAWALLATFAAQALMAAAPVDLGTPVAKVCGQSGYFPAGSFRGFSGKRPRSPGVGTTNT